MVRILLVEDEFLLAKLTTRQLEDMGFTVSDHVAKGPAVVESLRKSVPDLILMDIRLAGSMDGIEATELVRKEFSQTIPVIFLTGYDDDETRNRAARLEPLAYFVKPLNLQVFKKLVMEKIPIL